MVLFFTHIQFLVNCTFSANTSEEVETIICHKKPLSFVVRKR